MDDLLSILLQLKDEETGDALSTQEIRNEVMTLFVAGHETTTIGVLWALYLIGTHPEVLKRLESQVDSVLGDRPPTLLDLPSLPYAEMIF